MLQGSLEGSVERACPLQALQEQIDATTKAAMADTNSGDFLNNRFQESPATIIQLQQDAEESQKRMEKMHKMQIVQTQLIEDQQVQIETRSSTDDTKRELFNTPDEPTNEAPAFETHEYTLNHARMAIDSLDVDVRKMIKQCMEVKEDIKELAMGRRRDRIDQQGTEQALQELTDSCNEYIESQPVLE